MAVRGASRPRARRYATGKPAAAWKTVHVASSQNTSGGAQPRPVSDDTSEPKPYCRIPFPAIAAHDARSIQARGRPSSSSAVGPTSEGRPRKSSDAGEVLIADPSLDKEFHTAYSLQHLVVAVTHRKAGSWICTSTRRRTCSRRTVCPSAPV